MRKPAVYLSFLFSINLLACAQGVPSADPGPTRCMTSLDCQTATECLRQECINGFCQDFSKDQDGDGYIDQMCGGAANDCNDEDVNVRPQAEEICDCADNDCSNEIDDGCNYKIKITNKNMGYFGCFADKKFRFVDAPTNEPSKNDPPQHNTVFINVVNEGWGSIKIWYYGRDGKRYLFPSRP